MELHYEIHEDNGDGTQQLASQGIWQELPLE